MLQRNPSLRAGVIRNMKARAIATLTVPASAFASATVRQADASTARYDLMTRETESQTAGGGIVSGTLQQSGGHLSQVIGGRHGRAAVCTR
jgi:hypothetical protein